jgi:NAD-dependent dihydropyrimidine dehydrogenase PreA subunit
MAAENSVYSQLSERVAGKVYPSYIKVLENQLASDEANFLVDVADGKSEGELAKIYHLDEKALAAKIEDLMARRYVVKRGGKLNIPRSPRFFPQGPRNEKTRQLFTDFFRTGDYQKSLVEGWVVRLAGGHPPSHKVIPAHKAFLASPNIDPQHILWYEDMEGIFKKAKTRWQGGLKEDGTLGKKTESGCGCRAVWTDDCDYAGGCTGWEWASGTWDTDETLRAEQTRPAFPGRTRRELSVEQAMDACLKMEDAGQIHISPNTAQITSTCNCCPCCCVIMQPMTNYGDVHTMLAPSRYRAVIDESKCEGCQDCVERCHFDAVEMKKPAGSKKMKAYIINEHCMGCGLCIFTCPNKAMHLELVRPPAHIPTTPWMSPSATVH